MPDPVESLQKKFERSAQVSPDRRYITFCNGGYAAHFTVGCLGPLWEVTSLVDKPDIHLEFNKPLGIEEAIPTISKGIAEEVISRERKMLSQTAGRRGSVLLRVDP